MMRGASPCLTMMRAVTGAVMLALMLALILPAPAARAEFVLQLPLGAQETYGQPEPMLPRLVPIGPAENGVVPKVEGPRSVRRTVWRMGGEQTVDAVMRSILAQLDRRGYTVLFDCVSAGCGGFDFRFGVDVVDEPMMRVDLRAFRFITARQDVSGNPGYVTFLISRSPVAVYLQMTEYTPAVTRPPLVVPVTPDTLAPTDPSDPAGGRGAEGALAPGSMVLEGLEFDVGSARIAADPKQALASLADLLGRDETVSVLLVGHSDMTGSLEGNIAVSLARARAVRQDLIQRYGVAPARLTAHGIGFLSPRASNQTEEGRQKNRRVEAVFSRP